MPSVKAFAEKVIANVENVIVGKRDVVEQTVINILCRGHLLIEDVPGVGKTMLARSLAKSLGLSLNRIQFTPDMLPSDVTGVSIFNQGTREFEFRAGPIMAQIVLADEINRATPKTQAALLEAMQEGQVTVDGTTHILPVPFMVMATQNPIEYEGTFPLPEAQLDRFLMKVAIGYPNIDDEILILEGQQYQHPIDSLKQITKAKEVIAAQETVKTVHVSDELKRYIVELAHQTRSHPDVYLGASARGSLALYRASQAKASVSGREYVIPDDIKLLAPVCLAHRIILGPAARLQNVNAVNIVDSILERVPVPGGDVVAD